MPKTKPVNEDGRFTNRRLSANLPAELAEEVEVTKRPGESLNQAVIRLLEMGLQARATMRLADTIHATNQALKSTNSTVSESVLKTGDDIAKIKDALEKLVEFVNKTISSRS